MFQGLSGMLIWLALWLQYRQISTVAMWTKQERNQAKQNRLIIKMATTETGVLPWRIIYYYSKWTKYHLYCLVYFITSTWQDMHHLSLKCSVITWGWIKTWELDRLITSSQKCFCFSIFLGRFVLILKKKKQNKKCSQIFAIEGNLYILRSLRNIK